MGTEYYVVNDEREAGFETGKTPEWLDFDFDAVALLSAEELAELIQKDIYGNGKEQDIEYYTLENGWTPEYFQEIARRLRIFAGENNDNKLRAVIEDEWYELEDKGYRITNGRYITGNYIDIRQLEKL